MLQRPLLAISIAAILFIFLPGNSWALTLPEINIPDVKSITSSVTNSTQVTKTSVTTNGDAHVQITTNNDSDKNTISPTPIPPSENKEETKSLNTLTITPTPTPWWYRYLTPTFKAPTPSPTKAPTPTPTTKPSATATPTPQGSTSSLLDSKQQFMLNAINTYRSKYGLSSVKPDSYTCNFATIRAKEIVTNFSHAGFSQRINNRTIPYPGYSLITENIAMTSNYQNVVNMWVSSAGHAANMRKDTPFVCVAYNGNYFAYEGRKP